MAFKVFNIFDVFNIFEISSGMFNGDKIFTNCWTPLEKLPDNSYGMDKGQSPSGVMIPSQTADGTEIYSFRLYSDGRFYVEIGDTGSDQLFADEAKTNPIVMIIYQYKNDNVEMFWNETNLRYEGTDQTLATTTIADTGSVVCFAALAVPTLLIHYTYEEMEIEE